jgi:hypothetical protein
MSTKNILDFVAAIATGQSAAAVDFATAELRDRVQAAATTYGQDYQYKVGGSPDDNSTAD